MWHNPRLLNMAALLLTVTALAAFASGAAIWAMRRPVFALKAIRVEADRLPADFAAFRHVNVATVKAAALPRIFSTTKNNFFLIDLEAVRQSFEAVAWVRRAQVRREWPNRLVVKIEEHRVLGAWVDGRLVNTKGELFVANPAEAEEDSDTPLPELSGPAGSERDVSARYLEFVNWFEHIALVPDQVALSPRYAWTVHADNGASMGLTVEFGRERDRNTLAERATRMIAAWPQLTARWRKPTLIDLRYPNGFALRAEGLRLAEEGAVKKIGERKNPTKPSPPVPSAKRSTPNAQRPTDTR